jgi:hypothetical protein
MPQMNAWILDFGMGYTAAVGGREVLHLIDIPASYVVPCTPAYCNSVLFWQNRVLPLMDMASRVGDVALQAPFAAVVGYQKARGEFPQFGAIQLLSPPVHVAVDDEQACELPPEAEIWRDLSISCFKYQGRAVPVLNLNRLFATPSHLPVKQNLTDDRIALELRPQ